MVSCRNCEQVEVRDDRVYCRKYDAVYNLANSTQDAAEVCPHFKPKE